MNSAKIQPAKPPLEASEPLVSQEGPNLPYKRGQGVGGREREGIVSRREVMCRAPVPASKPQEKKEKKRQSGRDRTRPEGRPEQETPTNT